MKLYDVISKERGKQDITPEAPRSIVHHTSLPPRKISWKKMAVIGGAALLLGGIYMAGVKLVHARVTIVERRVPFSLEGKQFELVREDTGTAGRLSFQTMTVTTTVTREVYGSEIASSTASAKGKVVFFNEYSKSSQTIKAKTILIAAGGKRYQTVSSVTVPGYTLNGKIKTAGTSTPVDIIATATGPSYNSTGTSFTVSGWSTAASKQFYAQSAGALVGGEEGVAHVVSESEKAKVITTLQAQLVERLKRETRTQIPEAFIAFPDLQFVSIDPNSMILKGSSIRFPASITGTMVTYIIPRDVLESAIALNTFPDQKYPSVSIPNLGNIQIVPVTAIPTSAAATLAAITVAVSGQGTIITKAPLQAIKESLIGLPKKQFEKALAGIAEVDTARFVLYPFWAPFFPAGEKAITVVVK